MLTVYINGLPVKVKKGSTVLQACESSFMNIPVFCFHKKLLVAGNCRMCIVEVAGLPKPVASCATPVLENISVFTDTPLVMKARESVLEFLLVNHPLDCPVCDQGGECDLQNLSFNKGSDKSRFYLNSKRSVSSKQINLFVSMIMTRCIHCTRCVRFLSEVGGSSKLGLVKRSNLSEISLFESSSVQNVLSGNVIDLCPVGFLFCFNKLLWFLLLLFCLLTFLYFLV